MRGLALLVLLLPVPASAQEVWGSNPVPVVNPADYGVTGNCTANNLSGLQAAVDALPAGGGVVAFPASSCSRKDASWVVSKAHVKLWCETADCFLYGKTDDGGGKQSTRFTGDSGGVFGLRLSSDATPPRLGTKDDHQIVFDGTTGPNEVEGVEITGSAASGVFAYGGSDFYFHGNYIHHTMADHIHHTAGAQNSLVWGNFIFNEGTQGDDGVACVTYGVGGTKCGNMEWWENTIPHSGNGRGFAVVGGDSISIHDNYAAGTGAAGVYIATEGGSYNSPSSTNITVARNQVYGCGLVTTSHRGIIVYAGSTGSGATGPVTLTDNTSYGSPGGTYAAYVGAGTLTGITSTGLVTTEPVDGTPLPAPIARVSTTILKTRDTSFVASTYRPGLYRIHLKRPSGCISGSCLKARFEYIVKGDPGRVAAWAAQQVVLGSIVADRRSVGGVGYALVYTAAPTVLTPWAGLAGVTTAELRTADLSWLWDRL